MDEPEGPTGNRFWAMVRECVRRELAPGATVQRDDEDMLATGALDSMAWVGVLECIEQLTALRDVAEGMGPEEPHSIRSLVRALQQASTAQSVTGKDMRSHPTFTPPVLAQIIGWSEVLGSTKWDAAMLEREYSLAPGTIRDRAGIESATRVAPGEDELSLAMRASTIALQQAESDVSQLDCLIASSETFLGFPSLAASLHARLLLSETCSAIDVGGACVGLLNGLFIAKSLVSAGMAAKVLVVTADVHSSHLAAGVVEGEFGALFGDGASAFLLGPVAADEKPWSYTLGDFYFGCAGTFASALRINLRHDRTIALKFDGEALARAAVSRLQRIIEDLGLRSGLSPAQTSAIAVHQPNPRLLEVLARQANLPLEKFPLVSKTCGNLGSSTSGAALSIALGEHAKKPREARGPIFVAAVGPGLLWGGTVLH